MTLYLYAIVDRQPGNGLLGRGIGRQVLSLVRAGNAFVVVEPSGPREPTPRAIVTHDRIVRRMAKLVPSVLPLRFGTTAPDRAAVQTLIVPLVKSLGRAFDRVRCSVQFTLRVSGRRSPVVITDRVGPGTRWLAERLARQHVPEIAVITEATRPFVREARTERHDEGPHFVSAYHLVARENVRAWRVALARSMAGLPRGVEVTTTGPWAPWAFAELA